MKKTIILLISATLFNLSLQAQKGSWFLGGAVGLSTSQNKEETGGNTRETGKSSTWSFSPEIGHFLTDRVQAGLAITLAGSKTDNQSNPINTISTQKSLGGTLYTRYLFGKEAFRPYIGIKVSALPGNNKTTTGSNVQEAKTFNFLANINAGFGYGISNKFTVVGSFGFLGYNLTTYKPSGSNTKYKTSSFGLDASSLGERFNVGFYYTL